MLPKWRKVVVILKILVQQLEGLVGSSLLQDAKIKDKELVALTLRSLLVSYKHFKTSLNLTCREGTIRFEELIGLPL
jgi:hypothetical protein